MKIKELKTKDQAELTKLLQEAKREYIALKTKTLQQDLKNVRSIRAARKLVAQLQTLLRAKV